MNPGVQLAGYTDAAQANVQQIAAGLKAAGMPPDQVAGFERANSTAQMVAQLDPQGSGFFPQDGGDDKPRRPAEPDDTSTA